MSEGFASVVSAKVALYKYSSFPFLSLYTALWVCSVQERGGSSRQAILKYIVKHYNVGRDERTVNAHLKMALRAGVKNGTLKQSKGTGALGSFRVGEKKEKPAKKPKAARAKKPKAKKPKAAKKAAKPKKAGAAKTKKPKAKKPAAAKAKKPKTAKPKKPKTAAKAKKAVKK